MADKNFGEILAEHNLKILNQIEDKELYELIKAEHPKWSDEDINRKIEDMRSPDFAEWYRNLLREASDEAKS